MIRITNGKLLYSITRRKTVRAFAFFIFVIFRDEEVANDMKTGQHEFIHFLQQFELLFVFQWILYAVFYLTKRAVGMDHYTAYRANPFEKEAFGNESDKYYHLKRKPYAWFRYIRGNEAKY